VNVAALYTDPHGPYPINRYTVERESGRHAVYLNGRYLCSWADEVNALAHVERLRALEPKT